MRRAARGVLAAALATLLAPGAFAQESGDAGEARALSGMSVLGNNETPKALFIVPWKSSEIGLGADLTAGLMDDAMAPVDREVFMRQLQYHDIRSGETTQ